MVVAVLVVYIIGHQGFDLIYIHIPQKAHSLKTTKFLGSGWALGGSGTRAGSLAFKCFLCFVKKEKGKRGERKKK